MGPTNRSRQELPLVVVVRRVVALSAVAGYVEAIGYTDIGGIYPAIMTGNTVQFGLTLAQGQWARFGLLGFAIGLFFLGGIISSRIKRHLRKPALELILMAVVLMVAGLVRLHAPSRVPIELPLLALAMAMQGETIARFGGISLQTIVVTNNMVKFSDALVGRYLSGTGESTSQEKKPELKEVLMPGLAWLTYSIGAAAGALALGLFRMPLAVPAVLLVFIVIDLMATRCDAVPVAG
jgi:uncharacterized membrane protein YoaK (UPF0700 family)